MDSSPAETLQTPRFKADTSIRLEQAAGTRSARSSARFGRQHVELEVFGDLAAVAPLWRAFEDKADHTFFQTFAWLDAWQRHVGSPTATAPAIVTARHPDGTLLLVLPLAIQRRHGVRQLTFLGSDLCDYNAPLLHPDFAAMIGDGGFEALWTRIVALFRADPHFAFDVIDLAKMPERVGLQPNPLMVLGTEPNPSGAYLTSLSGTWDEFYAHKRSSATRKKERKQLRQLGEFGDIRFVDRLDGEERARTLDLLFEQKARSFARMGVRNIFTRPGYRELFTAFAMDACSRHLVHLSRLEVGPSIAAVSIGFTACSCYYLVLSSYEGGGEMARFGPGRAHLHELFRYAINGGVACFDFTIGDEPYKQDWSDARLTLRDHLSAATSRGAVAVSLITGFRKAKRTIKQNPMTWRLFSRARSLLGAIGSRRSSPAAEAGD